MNQVCLELDTTEANSTEVNTTEADTVDRTGFDIGWDHAHHGLVPPPQLLLPGTPVCQGWMAARAVFGRRTLASSRQVRQCLALRLQAWRRGIPFETLSVTANFLAQIHTAQCPIRRTPLGGAEGEPDAAVVERLNETAHFAAGNLAVMSTAAAQARRGVDASQAVRHARQCELTGGPVQGLSGAQWWRVATMAAFARPLPFAEAARLPLAVLPPNRVRLLNAAQGLQALVTEFFASEGWSARCRRFAQLLPAHTLRLDFNLFVGAMAPRVLEAGAAGADRRRALEDAWLLERVQRRWQHLVLSLGETATESLLEQATGLALTGRRVLNHPPAQAVEGWGVPARPAPLLRRRVSPAAPSAAAQAVSPAPARRAARPAASEAPSAPACRA
jgi:hypothetical protein